MTGNSTIARPDRAERADTGRNRRAILGAAARLFAERGPEVPLAEIAGAAGLGRGTLHRHFPARADLVIALFDQEVQQIHAFAAGLDGRPGDLDRLIDRKLTSYIRNAELALAVQAQLAVRDYARDRAAMAAVMLRLAQADMAAGTLRADCTTETFVVLQQAMDGAMRGAATRSERESRARLFRDLMMGGLRRRASEPNS